MNDSAESDDMVIYCASDGTAERLPAFPGLRLGPDSAEIAGHRLPLCTRGAAFVMWQAWWPAIAGGAPAAISVEARRD